MSIIIPFVVIAALGGILGFGLAVADKKLAIKKDEKLELLESIMPGANCGACGFAGCTAYAEAVYSHKAQIGLCTPGGNAVAQKMGQIMGEEAQKVERMVAYVFCMAAPDKVGRDFKYDGMEDCNAASILFKGDKTCKEGCLGLGSCINVCPAGAIGRDSANRVHVDRSLCIGCGKCAEICPNHVIRMIPYSQKHAVSCNSHDKGASVRKYCDVGCIGCGICENKCKGSGFAVESFLASFSPAAVSDSEQTKAAVASCPRKVIKEIR